MKSVVFLDTYYRSFMESDIFIKSVKVGRSYQDSIKNVEALKFGTGGSYVNAFRQLGWKADLIVPNSFLLQNRWSLEKSNKTLIPYGWNRMQAISRIPIARGVVRAASYFYSVVEEQITNLAPDLVVVQDLNAFHPRVTGKLKDVATILFGEIASPPPPSSFFKPYSLILSALPSLVEKITDYDVQSRYLPLAFDQSNAKFTPYSKRDIDVSFIGSFGRHQPKTASILRKIGNKVPSLRVYGDLTDQQVGEMGLKPFYSGQAWGPEMFEILGRSKIVVNRHGTVAGHYAVNMRMFEATGCGALLITENKSNLHQLFEVGREVVDYRSTDEAIEKISYYLSNPNQLIDIARMGQKRTLNEHNYNNRASSIAQIFEEYKTTTKN